MPQGAAGEKEQDPKSSFWRQLPEWLVIFLLKGEVFAVTALTVGPHVLFLVDFGFCQMGDAGILCTGDQTKLHSWPYFLGPGSSLRGREEGWGTDGGENTQRAR